MAWCTAVPAGDPRISRREAARPSPQLPAIESTPRQRPDLSYNLGAARSSAAYDLLLELIR